MTEPKHQPEFTCYESDSKNDGGVRLRARGTFLGRTPTIRVEVDVDGTQRAAYIGQNDARHLARFIGARFGLAVIDKAHLEKLKAAKRDLDERMHGSSYAP